MKTIYIFQRRFSRINSLICSIKFHILKQVRKKMKQIRKLWMVLMGLLSIGFSGCELMNQEELVEVAYFTPVYATIDELTFDISIDAPVDYNQSGKVITYGDYVFINSPNEGIHIIDNTDPSNPINKTFISLKGNLDMAIVEDHLYADMFSALVVLDISNIDQPVVLEDYTVEDVFSYNQYWSYPSWEEVQGYEHIGYDAIDTQKGIVIDWKVELREETISYDRCLGCYYDKMDVAVAAEDDGFSNVSTAGSMTRFLPIDKFLYAISFNELVIFELTETYQPLRWGKLDTQAAAETLFRLNGILYVGTTTGMLMYDVANPGNPNFINSIAHFTSCDPVVADDKYAYVTLRGGTNCWNDLNELQIIDIQDPSNISLIGKHIMFNPHGLAIIGDYLLVCDGTAGIKVLDVSDRTIPTIKGTYPIDFAYDVIVSFPTALVVGKQVMYQYDISNLPEMVKISEIALTITN